MRHRIDRLALALALLSLPAAIVGAEYAKTDVVAAARSGDSHAVHKLLELDPHAAVAATDEHGYTALHWAGIRAHWRIFSELLAAGAEPNTVGGDGGTPLHWACHHDRADMVAKLLDAGAETGLANRWGRTPLHVAARRNCLEVARLLLDRGAAVDATTKEGWTPLHVAAMSGHQQMMELLRTHGADPAREDVQGATAAGLWRPRPASLAVAGDALGDYVGIYELGDGFEFKVWRQDDRLMIREFAPDGLYRVGTDEFFCVQEPWRVRFTRNETGAVDAVVVDFLRRTVRGERSLSPRYVGSAACIDCHSGAEQGHAAVRWLQSRHGHAYWRLGSDWSLFLGRLRPQYRDLEKPIEDQRCLLCHVTGAQDDRALFAASYRREEGVGCEACHGPGSEYMDPEVMADRAAYLAAGGRVPDEATCRSCHRNSERFDWAEWWPKVAHPLPDAGEAGGES